MADSFGAPLTEPGARISSKICAHVMPSFTSPTTSETRCSNPGCNSLRNSCETFTLPALQTRPKSFRIKSTIITFSALSFSENAAPVSESLRVPFIGLVFICAPSRVKKSSGEADAISSSGSFKNDAKGAGFFPNIFEKSGASERSFEILVDRIRQAFT